MEGIILAGGKGTRLRSAVPDIPKCMAPVGGKPFLYYILKELEEQGFEHIILSLGYRYEIVMEWLSHFSTGVKVSCVIEDEPLGTGGAIKLALTRALNSETFVLNGDTFFEIPFDEMARFYRERDFQTVIALKTMYDFDRYGVIGFCPDTGEISSFGEKIYCKEGLINGGIYLLNKDLLTDYPDQFSFENEYLEKNSNPGVLGGFVSGGYFIDIGIPEDYDKAQSDFRDGRYKTL